MAFFTRMVANNDQAQTDLERGYSFHYLPDSDFAAEYGLDRAKLR